MRLTILFFFLTTQLLFSQENMQPGFDLLEKGKFKSAVPFFQNIVELEPQNKTAKLCLGRAVGLSGNASQSIEIFKELDTDYSNDYEIKLNLAEAHLWNSNPKKAKEIYLKLVEIDPVNFSANFGLANSYAKLNDNQSALVFINKALGIQPENQSAQVSRKYILLGLADQQKKQQQFEASNNTLNLILKDNINDREALINKGINYILDEDYKKARKFLEFIKIREIDVYEASILLSHLSILEHKNKLAISYADDAIAAVSKDQPDVYLNANIQKVNALGANKNFKKANLLIEKLENEIGESPKIELAKARMKTWDRQYFKGLEIYNSIEGLPYEVNMGKSEIFSAFNERMNSEEAIDSALVIDPNSTDALKIKNELQHRFSPSIELEGTISNDIGFNEADEFKVGMFFPTKGKHHFFARSLWRNANNELLGTRANQLSLAIGDKWQISRRLLFEFAYGALSYQNEESSRSISYLSDVKLNYRLDNKQSIGLSYDREALNYSSDLIESGIISSNYNLFYQFQYHKVPGAFLKYNYSTQSDGNSRNSIFGSIFYEVKSFPLIKVGMNYTTLSFKEDRSELYFSPDKYVVYEAFLHFANAYNPRAKVSYSFLFNFGKQKIDLNPSENIRRIELDVGYRFSPKIHLIASYFNNTAANSTAKGYSFTRYGLKLKLTL